MTRSSGSQVILAPPGLVAMRDRHAGPSRVASAAKCGTSALGSQETWPYGPCKVLICVWPLPKMCMKQCCEKWKLAPCSDSMP